MELEELVKAVDIVEYISQFIELKQKGNEWWGLSCFKDEKTPSFSVKQNPPFFYDYSSGKGGNVINFVKLYFNCSGYEAVQKLKEYAGIEGDVSVRVGRLAATVDCQKFKKVSNKEYKSSKGIALPNDYMVRYEKRDDKLKVWEDEGISRETLDKFQVYYDSFSNCLVYPIRNLDGTIVNIGGRTLYPDWKERDLRKYTYFYQWGTMNIICGLFENMDAIREKKEIIIFEGFKSVLLANTWGINNTCCLLTSHLNPRQMKILARLGYRVVFALDKEVKVRDDKNIAILKNYINVEYLCDMRYLIGEKDAPVDKGYEVFKQLYDNRFKYR